MSTPKGISKEDMEDWKRVRDEERERYRQATKPPIGEPCDMCGGTGCDCLTRPEGERFHSRCPRCHGEGVL